MNMVPMAFPSHASDDTEYHVGMTLRDYFAAKALVGLLSKLPVIDQQGKMGVPVEDKIAYNRDLAESCYWIADALLAAREPGAHG